MAAVCRDARLQGDDGEIEREGERRWKWNLGLGLDLIFKNYLVSFYKLSQRSLPPWTYLSNQELKLSKRKVVDNPAKEMSFKSDWGFLKVVDNPT
jgi:hypothetical protein